MVDLQSTIAKLASPDDFTCTDADWTSSGCTSTTIVRATLLDMPAHVIVKIMRYVNNVSYLVRCVAPTCRRLHALVYMPSPLWNTLDLQLASLAPMSAVRTLLHRVHVAVRQLSFYVGGEPLQTLDICTLDVLPHMARLHTLDLGFNVNLESTILDYFVDRCPNVRCVNLEGATHVGDSHLSIIHRGWPQLRSLGLSHCTAITDAALTTMFEQHTIGASLHTINIDGMSSVSDATVTALAAAHGRTLRRVYVDGEELTDIAIDALCTHCPHLSLLSISFAELLTDHTLECLKVS
jgi:hypothetical protein